MYSKPNIDQPQRCTPAPRSLSTTSVGLAFTWGAKPECSDGDESASRLSSRLGFLVPASAASHQVPHPPAPPAPRLKFCSLARQVQALGALSLEAVAVVAGGRLWSLAFAILVDLFSQKVEFGQIFPAVQQ